MFADPVCPMPLKRLTTPAIKTEAAALWQLAWPMLIGQLATVGMAVADVAMAGHASAEDLAAVSLGASVWSIIIVTLMGVMMSVNPTVAHHVGAEEHHLIPHVVRQALWKALGVGVVALLAAQASALIFDVMQLDPAVRDMAKAFVQVTSFALPAFACYRVLYGYSASLNETKPMMVIALLALGINILLNWLLIYGKFGLPRLGGVGCAWATLVCVWFNLLALLWWMKRSPVYRQTWPFTRYEAPHGPEIRKLLQIGLPIGVTYFAESSAFGLIALLVAEFGAAEVAAHQIALNFSSLVFMVPLSLSVALITRIGHALGEGDPAAARFRAWVGVGVSLAFAMVSATFIALFNHQIAAAYTSDAAVAATAAHLLIFAALFQLSDATQVSTSSAIRGYKVTRPPMVIHMAAFWGFSLPLGCILGLAPDWLPWQQEPMAAQGFWISLVVGLTVAALGLTWFLDRLSRRRLLRHAP
ncbi:multidrug resistance protein PmpM [Chitinimonas prasina]|uniref:Multidrug-efflux transporter n=2 Tax=Chitinimonas prasina TaxID=1434937 RepID=A0ABQ5YCU8_9NEIS|nr:multidrug resistance protein PmpM [Chitinimonas prasina]